jgi:hypothetical protein
VRSAGVAAAPALERDAGGVLVVLRGGAVWRGTATASAAKATKGTRLDVPFSCNCRTVMIIVCAGA